VQNASRWHSLDGLLFRQACIGIGIGNGTNKRRRSKRSAKQRKGPRKREGTTAVENARPRTKEQRRNNDDDGGGKGNE